jgi:predicted MFS family arabinose efflux permease
MTGEEPVPERELIARVKEEIRRERRDLKISIRQAIFYCGIAAGAVVGALVEPEGWIVSGIFGACLGAVVFGLLGFVAAPLLRAFME